MCLGREWCLPGETAPETRDNVLLSVHMSLPEEANKSEANLERASQALPPHRSSGLLHGGARRIHVRRVSSRFKSDICLMT